MRNIIIYLLLIISRIALWFRYRIEIKGLEKITSKTLNKKGGVLFLPNHSAALVDPAIVTLSVFSKFPIRPLIVEYMYFTPTVHGIAKYLNAIPIPSFESSNNSLKRKRHKMVISEIIKGLKNGENFLLYPAGRLKHTNIEKIGGASATHQILKEAPETNIVLIRTKGLWGSSFSRALTNAVPPLLPTIKQGLWTVLKNFFFFSPRRKVIIELEPAPKTFPYNTTRIEFNKWLENYYNRPDGLSKQEGKYPGETLVQISRSFWKNDFPEVFQQKKPETSDVELKDIDKEVQDKILNKLQELTEIDQSKINPKMALASDLGLDSLDTSELAMFINDQFDTGPIPISELTHVNKVMAIAVGKILVKEKTEESESDQSKWTRKKENKPAKIYEGDTMIEVFFNACNDMGNSPILADARSGILTYSRVKLAVCLLAEYIRHLPGQYIGVLLPASVGAFLSVFAIQLAGKVPLMINWTIGPRHLQSVRELSKVDAVLTSWAFLERLNEVDLSGIDDKLIMLETVKNNFSIFDKVRALIRSKRSTKSLLKLFGIDSLKKDDPAVLLFTSGSESMPKGVPLSHDNILSNQRAALSVVHFDTKDVLLAFLPPFHSFGFSTTGTLGLLAGIRTAFFPNPTDGEGLAKSFKTWGATICCGAPTFIKTMLKAATPDQLKTMRMCVVGAEKTPPDLIDLIKQVGKEGCLLEGYGITECSPMISGNFPNKPLRGVGKPFPGIHVIVVHPETLKILPKGEEGLFLVRGPNVFKGYINPGIASPFITVDEKEWYNTGDIGYFDQDGFMFISGRKKRFIKSGGEMVSLQAVETALLNTANKKGWKIQKEGPTLGLIAQENLGSRATLILICTFDTDTDEINQTLRDCGFSNLIKISNVEILEEIPVMGTGKINYRVLEEKYFKTKEKASMK